MPGLFSRLKNFVFEETIRSAEVNAELNNIINNMVPAKVDNYSQTVTQMQIQTDPGNVGTEVLAPALSGELERLRFVVNRIIGKSYWYQPPDISLLETNSLINQISGLPPNRIVSGAPISVSNALPGTIVADGASNAVTIEASATPLVFRIDGAPYTLSADLVISGLVQAPSTNNTALINDASLVGDAASELAGEFDAPLTIDTTGSEITSLVGEYAGFKIFNGADTGYFTAFVKSSTQLTNVKHGYMFDSTMNPVKRIAISDNDVITLMKMAWIYLKTDLSAEAVYTNPTYSSSTPSSPSVGDYWFDIANATWKRFNGTAWIVAGATLVGFCLTDSANTVVARGEDFFAAFSDQENLKIKKFSSTEVAHTDFGATVNVGGKVFQWNKGLVSWDVTANMESGYTATASTAYFLYIAQDGATKVSPQAPHFRPDFDNTFYHPYQMWRCVGTCFYDAAPVIIAASSLRAVSVSVKQAASQSITGGVDTFVVLDKVDSGDPDKFDTINYGFYSPSYGTLRITGRVEYVGTTASSIIFASLYLDTALFIGGSLASFSAGASYAPSKDVNFVIPVSPGQFYQISTTHSFGGAYNLDVGTRFDFEFIPLSYGT